MRTITSVIREKLCGPDAFTLQFILDEEDEAFEYVVYEVVDEWVLVRSITLEDNPYCRIWVNLKYLKWIKILTT